MTPGSFQDSFISYTLLLQDAPKFLVNGRYNVLMMFYQLLYVTGIFSVILGLLHFTFADRFGFMISLPLEGDAPPQFRLMSYTYDMKRSDLRGIIYVMNHCASYTILMTGIFDLFCASWIGSVPGKLGSIAVGGFWLVRAASQTYLGRRRGDWLVIAFFSAIGILHLIVAAS